MLDTVIVGGGLCGLALAADLEHQGRSYLLFEARARLVRRVLSVTSVTGMALDFGAAWFWPEIHPRILAKLTGKPRGDIRNAFPTMTA